MPDLQRHCFGAMRQGEVLDLVERFEDPPDSRVLVGETEDDEVVATCTLARLKHSMCRRRADLSGFVISEDWRGTGLARQLVEAAAAFATNEWRTFMLEIAVRGDTQPTPKYKAQTSPSSNRQR